MSGGGRIEPRRSGAVPFLLVAAAAVACARESLPGPDVAAQVGGEPVPYARFEAHLQESTGESGADLGSDVLSSLFDQFLDEELLARLAVERGLVEADAGRRAAVAALLELGLEGDEPTAAEVAAYYAAHAEEYRRPERVRLRQILVDDREAAERARAELVAGADFAEVAQRWSRDPSAARGGDQGELAREELPPAFADLILGLEPGEVSEIAAADYGFHLFRVDDRLSGEVATLEQKEAEIRDRLGRQRADALLQELVEEARSRYDVEVYARNLPFNYRGVHGPGWEGEGD